MTKSLRQDAHAFAKENDTKMRRKSGARITIEYSSWNQELEEICNYFKSMQKQIGSLLCHKLL